MSIIFFMENRISFVTHGKPNETCNTNNRLQKIDMLNIYHVCSRDSYHANSSGRAFKDQ